MHDVVQLEKMLSKNQVTLENLWDLEQDFGSLLETQSSICYEDCHNMVIKIDSKINRIMLTKCENIIIRLNGLISGLEIKGCNNIIISNKRRSPINSLIVEHSTAIKITLSKESHNNTVYEIDRSHGVVVQDHKSKNLLCK